MKIDLTKDEQDAIQMIAHRLEDLQKMEGVTMETTTCPPTTVEGWLKLLPEPQSKKALGYYYADRKKNNLQNQPEITLATNLESALKSAFLWRDTSEGVVYWEIISKLDVLNTWDEKTSKKENPELTSLERAQQLAQELVLALDKAQRHYAEQEGLENKLVNNLLLDQYLNAIQLRDAITP